MKKLLYLLIFLLLISAASVETLFTVITKKENALVNHKYKKFVLVDDATGYTLAKEPVKYDPSVQMPVNYFTSGLPESAGNVDRIFIIHNLAKPEGVDEYDWVLEDNKDENAIFFSRSKFVVQKIATHWYFVVRGERVLMKNLRTGNYLKISPDGKFSGVKTESEASKWKLIHVY